MISSNKQRKIHTCISPRTIPTEHNQLPMTTNIKRRYVNNNEYFVSTSASSSMAQLITTNNYIK